MPRRIYVFDPPDRFVAGTVGQPGNRTFFLQAGKGAAHVSVVLEKAQVSVLADRLGLLLEALRRQGASEITEPLVPEDVAPLDEPLIEAFRVGTLSLAWDGDAHRVVVEATELRETDGDPDDELDVDDDDPNGPDVLRVRLEPALAQAFVTRASRIVAAGRPPCPLCGLPLNPEGHICPRRNGYLN